MTTYFGPFWGTNAASLGVVDEPGVGSLPVKRRWRRHDVKSYHKSLVLIQAVIY